MTTGARPQAVAILSPGDMGAATGRILREAGLRVLTTLEGRSALTRLRAEESGFEDCPLDDLVREADLLLSILVPAEAKQTAERVAEAMRRNGATPVYADCNAVAPRTALAIEQVIRDAGAPFIDAGIIGPPPGPGVSTRFHCSGPDTAVFEALRDSGLDVRRVGSEVGQASGLKMVYAASTKGTTALWTELMVAASALGLGDALLAEFGSSPTAAAHLRAIPSMPRRARRWVGEMEEIALTFRDLGLTPHILEGAADMYRFVGGTPFGDLTSRDPDPALESLVAALAATLAEQHAAQ